MQDVSDKSLIHDSWVFSSLLSSTAIGNHSIYNPEKSSTSSKLEGASWNISYGDGSGASGDVYIDTLSIGGAVAKKQAVEVASNVSDSFITDYASGGLLGLGFDSINTGTLWLISFMHSVLRHRVKANLRASVTKPTKDILHQCQAFLSCSSIHREP